MDQLQDYMTTLQKTISKLDKPLIMEVIHVLQRARMERSQVFILGNGGSASTASHFVCDLAKNTRHDGLPHYRAIGLADNMEIFSAYANDDGYESVFSSQLANLIMPGDVIIAISSSGNSKNVLKAIEEAKKHNVITIGFTGFDGGMLGKQVDYHIHVESETIEHVEDIHLVLEHMIVKTLKDQPMIGIGAEKISAGVSASLPAD